MPFTLVAPIPLTETTTILPNPQFGDSEAPTAEVNILRTVRGRRRTYVKTKNRRRLQWTFRLSRNKAIELLEFYRSYHAQLIFIKDHNERRWEGKIVNNPFEIQMSQRGLPTRQGWPVGETCTVTLEFEGRRTDADFSGPRRLTPTALSQLDDLQQVTFSEIALPETNLKHNWDATKIIHPDNTVLSTWQDLGPAGNDLIGTIGGTFDPFVNRSPTYRKISPIFNLRPTVAFETVFGQTSSTTAAMRTTSNTAIFPNRRGTIFWVFAHTINTNWNGYLAAIRNGSSEYIIQQWFDLAYANRDSFNLATEFGVWAQQQGTGGTALVEQVHMSGSSSPFMPVNCRFQPVSGANDIRLVRSNTTSVPSLTPFIYVLSRDSGTNLRFRTNGVEREGATILDNPPRTGLFHVNNQVFVPQFNATIRGEWGQILVYNRALSTQRIEEVERYLSIKWGIELGTVPF